MWTDDLEVLLEIQKLRNKNHSWFLIYTVCSKKFDYDFRSAENIRKRFGENRYKVEKGIVFPYDTAYDELCRYVEKTSDVKQPKQKQSDLKKIIVSNCYHIPFHNKDSIAKMINEHGDADHLVIAGDFLDCYSVSRFSHFKNVPLQEEISQAMAVLDILVETFPKVTILSGNHEDRVKKHFEKKIGPELLFLVDHDIIELIASPYNVDVVKDKYFFENGNGETVISHFVKIGKDLVSGHFEKTSIVPTKAAHEAYNWIHSWERWFKMAPVSLFLEAHTHRLSKTPLNSGDVVVGESGCMCQIQDYAVSPKASYSAHLNGYWVVYQNKGVTDLNNSNFIIL